MTRLCLFALAAVLAACAFDGSGLPAADDGPDAPPRIEPPPDAGADAPAPPERPDAANLDPPDARADARLDNRADAREEDDDLLDSGEPCETDRQCASGACVDLGDALGERCAVPCGDDLPACGDDLECDDGVCVPD